MSVVHLGLSAPWWARPTSGWRPPTDPADPEAWVGTVHLPANAEVITLSCGSSLGEDGARLAVDAAALLLAARADRRVILLASNDAGWPPPAELERQVDVGRFRVVSGASDVELRRALWASTVHVAVGWRSGLWSTLIAALAAGTPVAGVGMAPASVIRHGQTGFLGAPEARSLADLVEWMAAAGASLMAVSRAAQALVSERFDSAAAAESLVQILRAVSADSHPPVRPPVPSFA